MSESNITKYKPRHISPKLYTVRIDGVLYGVCAYRKINALSVFRQYDPKLTAKDLHKTTSTGNLRPIDAFPSRLPKQSVSQ